MNLKTRKNMVIFGAIILISIVSLVRINSSVKTGNTITPNTSSLQPTQVIENYFKYISANNKDGVFTTVTEQLKAPNVDWGFNKHNYRYIKIRNISEDIRPTQKEAYLKYGHGTTNGTKEENLKIYKIKYTVKYKLDPTHLLGARRSTSITLIRKDKNSPWLIDGMGEC